MEIAGRTFLVTGGKSGLGEATAIELARAGAKVEILDLPEVDVTNEDAVASFIAGLDALHGAINCAGIGGSSRVTEFDLQTFRRVVEVNLVGTFIVTKHAAVKIAATGGGGVIVNTASNAAFDGQIGQAAYTASKAGVAGMTLPLARDLARHGIRVVTIAPGPMDTPMLSRLRDDIRESLEAQIPYPSRLGRAEEYAALVRHIVENDYLNGETIRLDGALRMGPR
ncbi:MAG: SDR family NAD(P)-dependent oxidoreductase [Gaiellaceae bacterium]